MNRFKLPCVESFAIPAAIWLSLVGAGCSGGGCSTAPRPATPPIQPEVDPQIVPRVRYCWSQPAAPARGKVRLLLDASGSMAGFNGSMGQLVDWVRHAISQLRSSTLQPDEFDTCHFNEQIGISNCSPASQGLTGYVPRADTNLDEAIRDAAAAEVSVIVTDGVGATSATGSPGCAGGVDAACVARSLMDAVHRPNQQVEELNRGLWILPLAANFNGTFYTEERVDLEAFRQNETISSVLADTEVQAVIQQPRLGSNGFLEFGYRGPRALLAIVLARDADLGRAVVQALWERAVHVGLDRREDLKGFESGIALLPPTEVYPGFLNRVRWNSVAEVDDPSQASGVMELAFQESERRFTIRCTEGQPASWRSYRLKGVIAERAHQSGCVDIGLLPTFRFSVRALRSPQADALADSFRIIDLTGGEQHPHEEISACFVCRNPDLTKCSENPIDGQWLAIIDYATAADQLSLSSSASPSAMIGQTQGSSFWRVSELSTERPSRQPHRVYGLREMMELFYRDVAQDKRSLVLTQFSVCRGD